MKENYCQSCGMPMGSTEELYGSNADGSKNTDYCKYCFADGVFTGECTMEEMITFCIPHMVAANPEMTEAEARTRMNAYFPTLKRWKTA